MKIITKYEARQLLRAQRSIIAPCLPQFTINNFGESIVAAVKAYSSKYFKGVPIVAGYSPIHDEYNILPALHELHCSKFDIALPIARKKRTPLIFRKWFPGALMEYDIFKTPIPSKLYPDVDPNILLVPMLGFTEKGFRLGYGGGFYDITIRELQYSFHIER